MTGSAGAGGLQVACWSLATSIPRGVARVHGLVTLVATMLTLLSLPALAQVEVQLDVSVDTVEVGDTFVVQAQAMSNEDAPSEPELRAPSGVSVRGPSVGSSHQISFVNGRMERRIGTTASWQLNARSPGEYTIGPASFSTPEGRVQSRTVRVTVVAKGTLQRAPRKPRGLFDDDDWPLGLQRRPRSLFDDFFGQNPFEPAPAPEEYKLEHAPDRVAFLRAELSKTRAVVGEQVTLSIYAYGSRGGFQEQAPREARRPDFYSHALVETSAREPSYEVEIAGRRYTAKLLRRHALFPLRAGKLEVGPMEVTFYGSGYVSRTAPEGIVRASPSLFVEVAEPPPAGRPAGYQVGTVGKYQLRAEVTPRTVERGGSVSVVATLTGRGNLPGSLLTPEQAGTEWLEPNVASELGLTKDGQLQGTRTFSYVVRLDREGELDLGRLSLPYYDDRARRYQTAGVDLGKVQVSPGEVSAPASTPERTKLSSLLTAKSTLAPRGERATMLADRPWFWWTALGWPAALVFGQGARGLLQSLFAKLKRTRESAARRVDEALNTAQQLARRGDHPGTCSAIERALFLDIEAKTGVKARGVLRGELPGRLASAGVPDAVAKEVVSVLAELDELRFGQATQSAGELVRKVQLAITSLPARKQVR